MLNLALAGVLAGLAPMALAQHQQGGSGNAPAGAQTQPAGSGAGTPAAATSAIPTDPDAQDVAVPDGDWLSLDQASQAAFRRMAKACGVGFDGGPQVLANFVLTRFADTPALQAKDFVALVHVVQFSGSTVGTDCWYVAGKPAMVPAPSVRSGVLAISTGTRIYGSRNVGVLFVHLDRNTEGFQQPGDIPVVYRAIPKKKTPINVQNLLGILQFAGLQGKETRSYWGHGLIQGVPAPSDITVFGVDSTGTQNKEHLVGKKLLIDNEGNYYWDASIGVPVTKLTSLQYSDTNQQFSPKVINNQTAYGLIDIYLFNLIARKPVDLKDAKAGYYPRIVAGPGVTGHPGDRFMVGGGLGIKEIQVFAGIAFTRADRLDPTAPANTATPQITQFYHSNLVIGLNIPVFQAIKSKAKK